MAWVCVVLIIGSMLYMAEIVLDYANHDSRVRPRVSDLKRQASELCSQAEDEMRERDCALERASDHKPAIVDLQEDIEEIKIKLETESIRKNRLEMVVLKASLRHTPKLRMAVC